MTPYIKHFPKYRRKSKAEYNNTEKAFHRNQKKPQWVVNKVLYLKAIMPNAGCRTIANIFNANQSQQSVSKSFVYYQIKQNQYQIQVLHRKLKNKPPCQYIPHQLWQIDLTQVKDNNKQPHTIIGIVEAHSRACLSLQNIADKSSLTILEIIIKAIRKYGYRPQIIRTDNEANFNSRLFRLGLLLLGIQHQKTNIACPWMNGRIERFFGTFKPLIRQLSFQGNQLPNILDQYKLWYNHVRLHQNLSGKTPAEVWDEKSNTIKQPKFIQLWDGILYGFIDDS